MTAPTATAGMLIRRPVREVFDAFVDPAITTRFWFTEGSGRLVPEAEVRWTWSMYGVATDVRVKAVEPDRRILVDWDLRDDPTEVEWTFHPRSDGTFVEIVNRGFGKGDVAKAIDSAGGFALVLAGAKIWLEHGIEPNFVLDRHPDARVSPPGAAAPG
jgi:uncharacterized protein YndB with AHSA1/START domain